MEQLREQGAEFLPDKEQLRQDADRLLSGLSERLEDLPALIAENVPGYHPPNPRRGRLLLGLLIGGGAMFLFDPKQGAARRRRIVEKVRGWFSGGQTPSGPYVEGYQPDSAGIGAPAAEQTDSCGGCFGDPRPGICWRVAPRPTPAKP